MIIYISIIHARAHAEFIFCGEKKRINPIKSKFYSTNDHYVMSLD